ncbi:MAG: hypothetical protein CMD68_04675 [Gammaproteobacteria bacterium]|nr:hypothetical protein [Gammaproteobacteria bacterium]
MTNSEFIKYGAAYLKDISAIHLQGNFGSVLELLQGQLTSDCNKITNQLGQASSLCDEKGFILCNFDIIFDNERWLILIDKNSEQVFLEEIKKFLPFYKVSFDILNCVIVGISRTINEVSHSSEHIILKNTKKFLSLIIDPSDDFLNQIKIINSDCWEINRKILGDHKIKVEDSGKYRPHELCQENLRISFEKGCFKGQEIIARMEYLGRLKKETRLILHSNQDEIKKYKVIGKTYKFQGNYFSSCLGNAENF